MITTALFSGLFAGLVASLVSIGIEKFGGAIGGVLGSIPSTIVPASIGLYLTLANTGSQQGIVDFQKSMLIVCPGMVVNACFLYTWRILPVKLRGRPKGYQNPDLILLAIVTLAAFVVWFALATAVILLTGSISSSKIEKEPDTASVFYIVQDKNVSASFYLALFSVIFHLIFGVQGSWKVQATPKSTKKVALWSNFARGFAAAIAIFSAILLGKIDPLIGGIASLFPAIFATAMISVWLISGSSVSLGAIEPLILGSLSVSVFSFTSAFLYPGLSFLLSEGWALTVGTLILYLESIILVSIPCYLFLRWRQSVNASVSEIVSVE